MFNEGERGQRVSEGPGPLSFDDSATPAHRYIIIKYLCKKCTFFFSHNRVWMMNVRSKTRHRRRRTNVGVTLDVSRCVLSGGLSAHRCWGASASDKSSPLSPAFDDLQRHEHKWTWVIFFLLFFFNACQHPQEWLASWVIWHEVSCRSSLTSRRTPLTASVWCAWQSHFRTCV